jgi:hypothetical protein
MSISILLILDSDCYKQPATGSTEDDLLGYKVLPNYETSSAPELPTALRHELLSCGGARP